MNITFVIDSYNDANGGTIATKRLIEELRNRGHKVSIVTAIHEDPSDPDFYQVPGFVILLSPIGPLGIGNPLRILNIFRR